MPNDTPYPSISNIPFEVHTSNFHRAAIKSFCSSNDSLSAIETETKIERLLAVFKAASHDLRRSCKKIARLDGGLSLSQVDIVCSYVELA